MSGWYIGRFAPSPTGPLHFGSLVAATASYLDARANGGKWLVRMEDVDRPRVQPGAADHILRTLEQFGFAWDWPVLFQSSRAERYREVLNWLRSADLAYACGCSRKDVAGRYPGICRSGVAPGRAARTWRVRTCGGARVRFVDRIQGLEEQDVEEYCGDFVVLRGDGCFAYQLAVVVDDWDQGVTDVVRGSDLLDSTARQIYLQQLLRAPTPRYLHTPVAVNAAGQKLSKQTRAPAVDPKDAVGLLMDTLTFLGQPVPSGVGDKADLWRWAIAHWSPLTIPRR